MVIADPLLEFLRRELALGFNHRPLAVQPARLNGIEPRTPDRQLTDQQEGNLWGQIFGFKKDVDNGIGGE